MRETKLHLCSKMRRKLSTAYFYFYYFYPKRGLPKNRRSLTTDCERQDRLIVLRFCITWHITNGIICIKWIYLLDK